MSTSNLEFKRDADGKALWHNPLPNPDFDPSRPYRPDNPPFSTCGLCGEPWPCPSTVERIAPVPVTGIWLRDRDEGRVLEVLAEFDGEWRVVIHTQNILDGIISHIVEPLGMRHSKRADIAGETAK